VPWGEGRESLSPFLSVSKVLTALCKPYCVRLSQYVEAFERNDVALDVHQTVMDQDLRELGARWRSLPVVNCEVKAQM
jgi:hypothetical protein